MPFEDLLKQVAGTLERDGRVQAVFGEAMKLEHHTIVPVAVITGGGGAGGAQGAPDAGFSGGMGLGLNVRPVGFIYENGDDVLFTPIHLDTRDRPLWAEAAFGVRRAIDLASSVLAQFMHRKAGNEMAPVAVAPPQAVAGDPPEEEVTSPS